MTIAAAHKKETRATVAAIAMELQVNLGQRLVAYVTGNRSPKVVGRWARGEGKPQDDATEQRLRGLYRTYLILRGSDAEPIEEAETVRNWLLGSNPHLDDHAPAEILRDGDPALVQRAAEEFILD